MAKIRVAIAIIESDRIISSFLLYRSAHTPAKGARKKLGTKPHMIDIVIITPDFVSSVINHIMAYWTKDDPKRDMA